MSPPSAAPRPTTSTSSPRDLSEDLRLGIFYAGPGTFWTDLKGLEQVLLGKLAQDQESISNPPRKATASSMPTIAPASAPTGSAGSR